VRQEHTLAEEQRLEEGDGAREFARCAGLGLAGYEVCDLAGGNLTLIFALSAWLRSSRIGTLDACSSMLGLRGALLEASELDSPSEPVPLLAGDARNALISLSIYVHGLICRSANYSRRSPAALVEEALQLLG